MNAPAAGQARSEWARERGARGEGGRCRNTEQLGLTKEVMEDVECGDEPVGEPCGVSREVGSAVFTVVKQTRDMTWFQMLSSRWLVGYCWRRGYIRDKYQLIRSIVEGGGVGIFCRSMPRADLDGDDSVRDKSDEEGQASERRGVGGEEGGQFSGDAVVN